jgi:hypothetical protein
MVERMTRWSNDRLIAIGLWSSCAAYAISLVAMVVVLAKRGHL